MQFSPSFKSSPYCSASPDGRLIATLSSAAITIRSTETLQLVHVVKLPSDLAGPVSDLLWSPSSSKILVAAGDQIKVLSARDSSFCATIRNPVASSGKRPFIQFGARDSEVLICAPFGLKFIIFDLATSTAAEVNNPKFYLPSSAPRGFTLRPDTAHLALLTRVNGKDMVSIHHPSTRQVQRSWYTESVDAQGLTWTPDGRWLLLWESPAHGHRLLLYTADGQLLRSIGTSSFANEQDAELAPGIKSCQLSPNAELCAVGDYSRTVGILSTAGWRDKMRLLHPTTIIPRDTLQIWQQQLGTSPEGRPTHSFLRATQLVSPPSRLVDGKAPTDVKPGCLLAAFDSSSALLATRLDDSPCTLWVWDVTAAELRAVLIFHSAIDFRWHPSIRELLLITCHDDPHRGTFFVWDPLSDGPRTVMLGEHLPRGKTAGRPRISWINRETEYPVLLVSDGQHYRMVSFADAEQCPTPWRNGGGVDWALGSAGVETPSNRDPNDGPDLSVLIEDDDTSALDDTFSFKHA